MGLVLAVSFSSKCLEKFGPSPVRAFVVGYVALCAEVLQQGSAWAKSLVLGAQGG